MTFRVFDPRGEDNSLCALERGAEKPVAAGVRQDGVAHRSLGVLEILATLRHLVEFEESGVGPTLRGVGA